jgi:predicted TIM-barrel fold metal-dependent hydrolase
MRPLSSVKVQPSAYFKRQCLIWAEPDESITAQIVEHLGADYFVWASDSPHIDASFNVVGEIRRKIASLPVESQGKVLGGNALRFYGIAPPSASPHPS